VSIRTFNSDGTIAAKAPRPVQRARIDEQTVQDPAKLRETLEHLQRRQERELARDREVRRFKDVAVGAGGATVRLQHGLGQRVAWWVADWQPAAAGNRPFLERSTASTADTLVLASYTAGTASIHVEAIDG
jgi:alpha-ketoglutarate-dependent taurine dioxygenase